MKHDFPGHKRVIVKKGKNFALGCLRCFISLLRGLMPFTFNDFKLLRGISHLPKGNHG
jgi:hypothetical protein